jgi:hypothetical protein
MFLHLKRDLDVMPADWIGCKEPPEEVNQQAEALTEDGVKKQIQTCSLASVPTSTAFPT